MDSSTTVTVPGKQRLRPILILSEILLTVCFRMKKIHLDVGKLPLVFSSLSIFFFGIFENDIFPRIFCQWALLANNILKRK